MSLKDTIQTAFLIVGFFTLLIFGASYYFMLFDTVPNQQPLKDSLTITASFFGGFATLTAAFIASRLFNDWKVQHNKNILVDYAREVRSDYKSLKAVSICTSEELYATSAIYVNGVDDEGVLDFMLTLTRHHKDITMQLINIRYSSNEYYELKNKTDISHSFDINKQLFDKLSKNLDQHYHDISQGIIKKTLEKKDLPDLLTKYTNYPPYIVKKMYEQIVSPINNDMLVEE